MSSLDGIIGSHPFTSERLRAEPTRSLDLTDLELLCQALDLPVMEILRRAREGTRSAEAGNVTPLRRADQPAEPDSDQRWAARTAPEGYPIDDDSATAGEESQDPGPHWDGA